MATTTWHTTPPTAPGLHIASTSRHAGFVRYWTGKHWTAPLSVMDLHLTDRIPNAQGCKAVTHKNRRVQWLEAVTIDADGFISWGGKLDTCPVPPGMPVEYRSEPGSGKAGPLLASTLSWARVSAYRVVPPVAAEALPYARGVTGDPYQLAALKR